MEEIGMNATLDESSRHSHELAGVRHQSERETAFLSLRANDESLQRFRNSSESSLTSHRHVPPELFPGMLLGELLVRPVLVDSGAPTASPCSVCDNFREHRTDIDPVRAEHRAKAGCLGRRLIVCACERFMQEKHSDFDLEERESVHTFESLQMADLKVDISDYHPHIRVGSERFMDDEYEIFTTAEVRTRFRRGVEQRNIPFRNSGTIESFDLIARWIRDCGEHDDCHSTEAQLPSRVLDISHPNKIRLRSGAGLAGRYCALSHCWGHLNKPARTTKATLASHQARIKEHTLSETFRNAIALARHLSIQFIWIDSLCIIQDDAVDWQKESAKMASVYQNAYLVIAATQAKHGGIGCFSQRSEPTLCFDIAQVNHQTASVYLRTQPSHMNFSPYSMYNAGPSREYPLLSRAWCLQERLLATRLVHFAGEELVWECRTRTRCECSSLDNDGIHGFSFRRRWATDRDPMNLFDLWHKTARLYNKLHITRESDRLPALSGLAKHLQDRGCGEYVAGIWVKNVFADLMWSTCTGGPRPEEWRAPSWSWVSTNSAHILFATQQDNSRELVIDVENLRGPEHPSRTPGGKEFKTKFVSIDYDRAGADPTGNVTRAELSISAPVIDAMLILQPRNKWKLQKGEESIQPYCLDYLDSKDDFSSDEVPVLCVWIGTVWKDGGMRPKLLLLQPSRGLGKRAASPGCYERVGAMTDEVDGTTLLKWFTDAEVQCIKIV